MSGCARESVMAYIVCDFRKEREREREREGPNTCGRVSFFSQL